MAEVASAARILDSPAARLIAHGEQRDVLLDDIETLFASDVFVVDACRYVVRDESNSISLATRPILFALARALAEASPNDVPRHVLVTHAFRVKHIKNEKNIDESYRARLRVEIGRLRTALRPLAEVKATPRGFVLAPHRQNDVVVLARPIEEKHAAILAFLAEGEPWSSSALALALGSSQRTVQRALDALAADGKIQSFGAGRSRRWLTPPLPGFATTLLLPSAFAE
jgi:DNA-binding transcriptional ArsR family regulator